MGPTLPRWPLVTGTAAGGGHSWEAGPQAQRFQAVNLALWKLNWTDGFTQGKAKAQRHEMRQKNVF